MPHLSVLYKINDLNRPRCPEDTRPLKFYFELSPKWHAALNVCSHSKTEDNRSHAHCWHSMWPGEGKSENVWNCSSTIKKMWMWWSKCSRFISVRFCPLEKDETKSLKADFFKSHLSKWTWKNLNQKEWHFRKAKHTITPLEISNWLTEGFMRKFA